MRHKLLVSAAFVLALLLLATAAPVSADPPDTLQSANLLIKFQPGLSPARIGQALASHGLSQGKYDAELDLQSVQLPAGADLAAALRSLKSDPRVLLAEPNYRVKAAGRRLFRIALPLSESGPRSNDPYFDNQWGLQRIQAPAAWTLAMGQTVSIAVIDSGVDLSHPDLSSRIVRGRNFVSPGTPPQDDFWHGTHVAGIAAAIQNNHIGIAGTAVSVTVMPLKILDSSGEGTLEDLVSAIHFAARSGARIINMSLGTLTDDNRCPLLLQQQVDFAHSQGVLLVAAAGNQSGFSPFFPAACRNVVAVTSSDSADYPSWFDNTGDWIDITAPGEDILSTIPGGNYDYGSGTSMSTPFVAGAAAMVWSRKPSMRPDDIERILEHAAYHFGSSDYSEIYGWGILNAAKSLAGSLLPGLPPGRTRFK
jgi:thermitase